MVLSVDLSTWHRCYVNTRAGTLTSVSDLGNTSVTLTTGVSRGIISKKELQGEPSNCAYRADDVAFEMPTEYLSGIRPKPKDKFTDDQGTIFRVLSVEEQLEGTYWRLLCRNLVLVEGLSQTGDYYRAVFAQDAAASRVPSFSPYRTNLPCRIQPLMGKKSNQRGKLLTSVEYAIYLDADLEPTADDQFRSNGVIYEIQGWHNPERVDELLVLEATVED